MDARVGGGFQAMANYGASVILAFSSQTLGARFGNGTQATQRNGEGGPYGAHGGPSGQMEALALASACCSSSSSSFCCFLPSSQGNGTRISWWSRCLSRLA